MTKARPARILLAPLRSLLRANQILSVEAEPISRKCATGMQRISSRGIGARSPDRYGAVQRHGMSDIKQRVALSSMAASAGLTAAKAVVGIMTGSLGLLSEAAHSLIDLGA